MRAAHSLAIAAVLGVLASVGSARALDVADEAAVRDAFNAHTGRDAALDDLCIHTDPAFPDVAVVGSFAHDRGCMVQLILAGGDWLAPGAASSPVLTGRGWREADAAARAALALDWVAFAVFPFHDVVRAGDEDFARADASAFAAPDAVADGHGGVVVTLWVREPAGMLRQNTYKLWALTFDRDGRQVRTRVLDDHVVAY